MRRKERRELGLLPRQILADTIRLAKAGDIDSSMSANQIALVLATDLSSQDGASAAWDEVDWERILELITKLVELILKVWPLFL